MSESISTSGAKARRALPVRARAGYASAEWGTSLVEFFIQVYLLEYYIVSVGLEPWLAGSALALAVVWDAFSDPLMGTLSDRVHLRWGKRLPWMVLGAPALALGFFLLFQPPAELGQGSAFLYLLCSYLLVNTAMTVHSVPHIALAGELTSDGALRTELFGWRLFFSNLGLLGGMLLPALLAHLNGYSVEDATGMERSRGGSAWVAAAVVLLTTLWCLYSTRGRDRPAHTRQLRGFWCSWWNGLRDASRNRVFMPLLAAFLVAGIGRTLNASLALLYYKHYLLLSEDVVVVEILLVFVGVMIMSIPVWVWMASRFGKKTPALVGMTFLGAMTCVVYPLFPPGHSGPPIVAAVAGGFAVGAIILFESLVADVVDHDELHTGQHREGLYFGYWKMGMKLARAFGLVLTGLALAVIGFDEGASEQAAATREGLSWLFGPGVGIFFLLAAVCFWPFPLTRQRARRVEALLHRKRDEPSV